MKNSKVKKIVSTTVDYGDGIRGTMSVDEGIDQETLDTMYLAYVDLSPRLYECAVRHLDEFNKDDQKLIKLACDGLF